MSTITTITGTAIPKRGNDIDTDAIIPARFLKEITFARMGEYPFFDERFEADGTEKPHVFNDPRYREGAILLVNRNFGCGSSREHAPQALMRFGIRAIVGESFAAIFQHNCQMLGVAAVTVSAESMARLQETAEADPAKEFTLDLLSKTLAADGDSIPVDLPEATRQALTEGTWDSTSLLLSHLDDIRATAQKLPYVGGFA